MKLRGLSQSDIARISGVSRQAVSLWFTNKGKLDKLQGANSDSDNNCSIQVRSQTLLKLAQGLDVPIESLLMPFSFGDNPTITQLKAEFLWDKLYPSIEEFVIGLIHAEHQALARLVQCLGLFESASLIGKKVWRSFPHYKKYILPQRRRECENIWTLQKHLGLI